jgi:SAM-dependent MidA family methyltransferase
MAGALLEELCEQITSGGPMPFESFMRLALYDPRNGYYATRVPGQGGDYGTSPSRTPWFGRLVVRELLGMWEAMGRPERFTVVEVGAGRADLAAAALEAAGPLAGALRWRFVERFDAVRELQRLRLGEAAASVEWSPRLEGPPAAAGCVLAHEVLDNFPVHLLELGSDGEDREVHVDVEQSRLVERLGPVSSEALADIAREAAAHLAPGARLEVCGDLEGWCREASAALEAGYLLVVDYGDVEPDLWLRNPRGTVVTYGPDGFGEDPLADPGLRDVTADVNFSALSRHAHQCGFEAQLFATQRDWLRSLGADEVARDLEREAEIAHADGLDEQAFALNGEVSEVLSLLAHMGLGDIMVFRASKGAPVPAATR